MGARRSGHGRSRTGGVRPPPEEAHDPAALSRRRAPALPAGGHPSGESSSTSSSATGTAGRSTATPAPSSTSGPRASTASVPRHRAGRQRGRLRVPRPLGCPPTRRRPAARARRRPGLHQALLHGAAQRLRDELRYPVRQRDPRPQPGAPWAASPTTPARAGCRRTTSRTAATSSGRSGPATSALAPRTATSTRRPSRTRHLATPSSASHSSRARAPSPASAACYLPRR